MTDTKTALRDAVSEALNLASSSPGMNEAATCDWIIRPLIHAAGYKTNEILPQGIDTNNQKPDYTILPTLSTRGFSMRRPGISNSTMYT